MRPSMMKNHSEIARNDPAIAIAIAIADDDDESGGSDTADESGDGKSSRGSSWAYEDGK